jgi:hypothetical protein
MAQTKTTTYPRTPSISAKIQLSAVGRLFCTVLPRHTPVPSPTTLAHVRLLVIAPRRPLGESRRDPAERHRRANPRYAATATRS